MRYAFISDIHSNLQALEEGLALIEKENVDEICCLGDIVGYNANPCECLNIVRDHPKIRKIVVGNHDFNAYSDLHMSDWCSMSYDASVGIKYTRETLKDNQKKYLKELPFELVVPENEPLSFLMIHGSPLDPFDYVLNTIDAKRAFDSLVKRNDAHICFHGHTHGTSFCRYYKSHVSFELGKKILKCSLNLGSKDGTVYFDLSKVENGAYYLINPGSIGQPRDGSRHSSYAIFDTDKKIVEIKFFGYNTQEAIDAILKAGYSKAIAKRLEKGK